MWQLVHWLPLDGYTAIAYVGAVYGKEFASRATWELYDKVDRMEGGPNFTSTSCSNPPEEEFQSESTGSWRGLLPDMRLIC